MRLILLLAVLAALLIGCGSTPTPDASPEARSGKENKLMKEAGGDE